MKSFAGDQGDDKAQRRKNLRLHGSQVTPNTSSNGRSSRQAGDEDEPPYKKRMRDRHESSQQPKKSGPGRPANLERFDNGSGDEYYQELVRSRKKPKIESVSRMIEQEEVVHGKRGITYAIEKNKGLMPKRNKDVRNPRVKKRKKYDEKKKKLSSIRQVYKGGEGRGGYGGELTGIKTDLVKSVKL